MKICLLKKKEVPYLIKIVEQNYSKYDSKKARKEILEMFRNSVMRPMYIAAKEQGEIIGFLGYVQSFGDYHIYQIFWVNVSKKHQRKGIGSSLIEFAIKKIKEKKGSDKASLIQLTTTSPNFYERFGFKEIKTFKKNKRHLMILSLE